MSCMKKFPPRLMDPSTSSRPDSRWRNPATPLAIYPCLRQTKDLGYVFDTTISAFSYIDLAFSCPTSPSQPTATSNHGISLTWKDRFCWRGYGYAGDVLWSWVGRNTSY